MFMQITAAWLREQGDWAGAKAVKEDWALLVLFLQEQIKDIII
jgi:hypothetical protein